MQSIMMLLLSNVVSWVLGRDLWEIAKNMVLMMENENLSGEEKRAQVIEVLITEATTLGKQLTASLASFAVEAALQYVRRASGK